VTGINRDAISTRLVVGEREEYARQRATLHTGTPIFGRTLARVACGADGDHIPLAVKAGEIVAFSPDIGEDLGIAILEHSGRGACRCRSGSRWKPTKSRLRTSVNSR
jgi:hypothetical protein